MAIAAETLTLEHLISLPRKIAAGFGLRPTWSDDLRASVDGWFPHRSDLEAIGLVALGFSFLRPAFQYGLLKVHFSVRLGIHVQTVGLRSGLNRNDAIRFSEALFQFMYYTPMMILGAKICLQADWFWNFNFWNGASSHVMRYEA